MLELAQQAHDLIGINISKSQLKALERFESELLEWNTRINLTAIDDPQKIRTKHFLDSLSCLLVMRATTMEKVIDIGTGAGFPGIPLKIVCPWMQITLVESVGKKAAFCQHIIATLKLQTVQVLQERAEVLGTMAEHRQQYDWAIARAVATLPTLMEYLLPLVKVGGYALAMKGENALAEVQSSEKALRILGGSIRQLQKVTLPGVEEERYLLVVDKLAATPDQYPRRVGVPTKRPI